MTELLVSWKNFKKDSSVLQMVQGVLGIYADTLEQVQSIVLNKLNKKMMTWATENLRKNTF